MLSAFFSLDHDEAVAFIENIKEKVFFPLSTVITFNFFSLLKVKNDIEARILSMVAIGELKIAVKQMDIVKVSLCMTLSVITFTEKFI